MKEYHLLAYAMEEEDSPRWMDMPSIAEAQPEPVEPEQDFHDLGDLYPDAPVPRGQNDVIIHRGILHDSTGISKLFDWVAAGDIAIVELKRMIDREVEFASTISRLQELIEGDLGGALVQIGAERLILLPAGYAGVKGIEAEVFAPEE